MNDESALEGNEKLGATVEPVADTGATPKSAAVQHTPGPWSVWDGGVVCLEEFAEVGDGNVICLEPEPRMVASLERWDANAPLIAAAPDLLDALAWYADQFCEFGPSHEGCGRYDDDTCAGCKASAAIAKALPADGATKRQAPASTKSLG